MKKISSLTVLICLLVLTIWAVCCLPVSAQQDIYTVTNYVDEDGLAGGRLTKLKIDPAGWIWVGSKKHNNYGGGLSVINLNRHILSYGGDDGLSGNDVHDLVFDEKDNCIWIATNEGISGWNSDTGEWKSIKKAGSNLTSENISLIHTDKDGNKYIGTEGGGLYKMNAGSHNPVSLRCPQMDITGVLIDKKGRLWASGKEGIAYQQEGVWVNFNQDNSSLSSNHILAIAEAPEGEIMGATTKGIVLYDGISWKIMDTRNSDLPLDQITDIMVDENGSIWIATWGMGLCRYDSKLRLQKIYNRKNSDMLDNRIISMAKDSRGDIWLCTDRGVTCLHLGSKPADKEKLNSLLCQAYEWTNKEEDTDRTISIQTGLARDHYGKVVWGWSAFFAGEELDKLEPAMTLQQDILGNKWLDSEGGFKTVKFLQTFITTGEFDIVRTLPNQAYPFPDKFNPEIQMYLKSGKLIPSDNQEVTALSKSLVKDSSRGDMLKTAQDIIFSKFFADMPYMLPEKVTTAEEFICSDPRTDFCRTAAEVIQDKAGISYSKNRLACALLKASGIPARLINNGEYYIGEAYINELGWVPFDASRPVYSVFKGADSRIQFPTVMTNQNVGVISVSGSDDNGRSFYWTPANKALFYGGEGIAKEIKNLDNLKTAQILLVQPAIEEIIPVESRIPFSRNACMTVKKEGHTYNLKFYDMNNRFIERIPIETFDKTMTIDVGQARMTFIPAMMGDCILLRIFQWDMVE